MSALDSIRPKSKAKVRDLVKLAGVDVSDWENFREGPKPKKASMNPKYCYEWAYGESGKVVVLNLWFDSMLEHDGTISYDLNPRRYAQEQAHRTVVARRARSMDELIKKAFIGATPVRVIVIDGLRRNSNAQVSSASRVTRRLLDSVPWTIAKYDMNSGACKVVRGSGPQRFVDQFDLDTDPTSDDTSTVNTKTRETTHFIRREEVRRVALMRAGGLCEWCKEKGFVTSDGSLYLETHHVIPLSEGGSDRASNVAALCPNHHRQAHYWSDRSTMRQILLERIRPSN